MSGGIMTIVITVTTEAPTRDMALLVARVPIRVNRVITQIHDKVAIRDIHPRACQAAKVMEGHPKPAQGLINSDRSLKPRVLPLPEEYRRLKPHQPRVQATHPREVTTHRPEDMHPVMAHSPMARPTRGTSLNS
ncbi:MAG: hypothetical protein DIZ78_02965 [endosymbiont of Escarpia spicata]|uniref:Uncharacterized protein n=1 Tax=endosymbiont of Escarpia spicata TaxID=2200908 RepID=A0A370DS53_9GAMM|nr:MAG: hypothetical protein DIZ78_02965 [endosymbiont of Escarpia spicata]